MSKANFHISIMRVYFCIQITSTNPKYIAKTRPRFKSHYIPWSSTSKATIKFLTNLPDSNNLLSPFQKFTTLWPVTYQQVTFSLTAESTHKQIRYMVHSSFPRGMYRGAMDVK